MYAVSQRRNEYRKIGLGFCVKLVEYMSEESSKIKKTWVIKQDKIRQLNMKTYMKKVHRIFEPYVYLLSWSRVYHLILYLYEDLQRTFFYTGRNIHRFKRRNI